MFDRIKFILTLFVDVKENGDCLEHYFTNNSNLKSEMRTIKFEKNGLVFTFFSDLGVFSKDRIDYGSRALLNTIIENETKVNKLLDVGCGYGFLGITLSKILDCEVLMSDVNDRALHLCKKNIKENHIRGATVHSDIYSDITGKFDMVVTNPPIRAGKKVVLEILLEAYKYLNDDGILWFVIRKDQGAKSVLKEMEQLYECEVVKKDKGFYCMKAIKR